MKTKSIIMGRGICYLLSALCLVLFLWAATGSDDSSSSSPSPSEPKPPVFDNGVETDESTNVNDDAVFRNDDFDDEDED